MQPADRPRIPMPALDAALNLSPSTWKVLTDSIFPSAKTAEGILLAVHYCAARNLDVMKRPVHVVPMWSKALGQEVETIWPGIAEVQTTAARTGLWAGIDSPRFGPLCERTFTGRVKRDGSWQELELGVAFPEWCEVTVYRIVNGQRCPFTEPVFWLEAYARLGGAHSELPTEMWVKRPRGQLMKCAKAASLRAAFPEEATYTAEEMEGKVIEADTSIPVQRGPDVIAPATSAAATEASAGETPATDGDEPGEPAPSETPSPKGSAPPTSAPTPADPDTLDPTMRQRIDKVVARAAENAAWKQAEQYLRARCDGADLAYALHALSTAQAAPGTKPAAQQAA
ncbi:MAG: phage recombination protein Bet [Thiohalocapsa sp.]|nr:phage recombination protein Bet [Thiohalocapsa sp.]